MILFYILGFITALSISGYLRYRSLYKKIRDKESDKDKLIASLKEYKSDRESKKRPGRLTTTKWHNVGDNGPNKKLWNVVFELKEVAQSADSKNKYKFEITGIFSEDSVHSDDFYQRWFFKQTGGGWIDVTKTNFEWITSLTKEDIRDDKLSDLGI